MNNSAIYNVQYSFAIMIALLVFTAFHVFFVNKPKISQLSAAHASEGFSEPFENFVRYRTGLSDRGPAGEVAFDLRDGSQSGFFGGQEAPVFYDIGDVRAARTTRGVRTGYLSDARGDPVYDAAGNPVMASAGQYLSDAARAVKYGASHSSGSVSDQYNMSDERMMAAGWTKDAAGRWVKPAGAEGMWAPVKESFADKYDEMNMLFGTQ
jgi:hypothetical protein